MLGRRIAARQPPPTFLLELRRSLIDEWCNILQDQIAILILSMPTRSKRFIRFHRGTGSSLTRSLCIFTIHMNAPSKNAWDRGAFTCVVLDAHASTPSFGGVPCMSKLDCSGMEQGCIQRPIQIQSQQ
ncbi:hypothetical protein TNCV_2590891 [Trichonephila clavipes]|nr:hypothetical protein TNCV_2590891 [Trichonephila clavipes]